MLLDSNKIKMSKRQKMAFNNLANDKLKLQYLMTHCGIEKRMTIERLLSKSTKKFPNVYTNKGDLMNFWKIKTRELYNVSSEKIPDKSGNWYGVEIECYLKKDDFDATSSGDCDGTCRDDCDCYTCDSCGHIDENNDCNCECNDSCGGNGSDGIESVKDALRRLKIKNIQVVSDGSLHGDRDHFGLEIKVLFKLEDTKNLEQVCKFLADHDAMVDESCGLHVHVDARSIQTYGDTSEMARKYDKAMAFLKHMLPKSRQNNDYCKDGLSNCDRYRKVNTQSLEKHGTIEIRAHSGTVNLNKIVKWCQILHAIKLNDYVDTTSLLAFIRSINVNDDIKSYMLERISKFNPNTNIDVEASDDYEQSEAA